MKKYILSVFCTIACSLVALAQELPVDSLTKKITFSETVNVNGAKKEELFTRAKNLNMKRDNVKVDDKEDGTYSYKGKLKVNYPAPQVGMNHSGFVNYTVTVFVKAGRYKYIISDFIHESEKGNGGKLEGKLPECNKYVLTLSGWNTIKKQTLSNMEILVKNIKESMNPTSDVPKNTNDW